MSGKQRESNVKWESSTEEEDAYESKYNMRIRESLRNAKQSAAAENEINAEPRKRGRGPSKRPCLNRNALMARENRLRKKAYLEKIENKLSFYQQENKNLVNLIRKQGIHIKQLSGEVAYLRSVLNNNTSITALLKTINDGLQKISTQKKSSFHLNHVADCSNELNDAQQQKSTYAMNAKQNVLNAQNTNIFVANVNDDTLMENTINGSQSNESYVNPKRPFTCKDLNINNSSSSFLDSDHTYTISKNPAVDIKSNLPNKEMANSITSTTSSISDDSYIDNTKDLDNLLPITQTELPNIAEKKDGDTMGIDFDQLSTFNMDIFEDLPKCDEIMNSVDSLNEASNLFTEEEISHTLDNTGICLHVNSDKVSLEFCSTCHLNSKNSGLN
ncbi:uncharacterized protein LOC143427650 isoform X1 [Xylocopa sonorina]|uniref:uncharacterized protein LOC143427650 isoform X1 n=1 Tax=Xylocopa sonorina TaxID=1818115 RepID=UPI00403B18D0